MLDRESIPRYSLVIVAQDVNLRCHKGRTELVVDVGDVNDNGPKFGRNPYQFSIGEKAALQQIVGYVSATDKDSGSNAKLRYSIVAGTGRADFMINPDTGRIHVARALDYERQSRFVQYLYLICKQFSYTRRCYLPQLQYTFFIKLQGDLNL